MSASSGTAYLNALQVKHPDPALDLMVNRWLLYQVLACRVWASPGSINPAARTVPRSASQDVMALSTARRKKRERRSSAPPRGSSRRHVQHWWHPPSGVGVRTRITDDLYFPPSWCTITS
jgi:cellobiose phosphorylase